MNGFPDKTEAEKIWLEGIMYRRARPYPFSLEDEYRFHTTGVAAAAEKLAARIDGLNPEKAYVLGLLHDYGKRISERRENVFHAREGYEQMMLAGWPDVARVCLTHSFADKNFDPRFYSYPAEWLVWAKEKLADMEYDDYDYLICYCDKFFEKLSMVTPEQRAEGIAVRYKMNTEQKEYLLRKCTFLKKYFDEKTGEDTCKILGLK